MSMQVEMTEITLIVMTNSLQFVVTECLCSGLRETFFLGKTENEPLQWDAFRVHFILGGF